jgi:hypothetical protein
MTGRNRALGSTQSVTEMSTRNISWGTGGRCIRLTTLHFRVQSVSNSVSLNLLVPSSTVIGL